MDLSAFIRGATKRDELTRRVFWLSRAASVRGVAQGLVLAIGVAGCAAAGETAAQGAASGADPVSFALDVVPVLTKFGCNSGGCHGKASGRNGFKLSLFGFDPEADFAALVQDGLGRRVAPAAPETSLILRKATARVPHGGGQRFLEGSGPYQLLRRWVAEGTPGERVDAPKFVGIEVAPAECVLAATDERAMRVVARTSDGGQRDVTATAQYFSQNPALVQVDERGVARTLGGRGEGTVTVRYLGAVASVRVLVPYRLDLSEAAYAGFAPRNFIDELALKKWRKLGVAPSPPANDPQFLRRATLDVTGALPTPAEVRAFLADPAVDKRDRLIDRLLADERYASLWAGKWGDLLRNKQQNGFKESSAQFADWLRAAFAKNMPFDQFARELLAVTGARGDHPQIDWYRQLNSNQNRVEDVSQVFLGLRVSCAHCHNHPFERISQNDYWQFAAFFARLDAMPYGPVDKVGIKPEGEMTNPRTGKAVKPKAFGGPEFDYVKGEDPRVQLVDWMTGRDNPYFARAICNRLWAHYLNRGLVEAPDDMRATNPPTNPELLDALAAELVGHGYDLKHLTRLILRSRVYGLSADPTPENAADPRNFARHYPKRLHAQVLLDVLSAATGVPEQFRDYPNVKRAVELPTERVESDFLDVFGRSPRDTPCECEPSREPSLTQVLFLMYSPELQTKLAHPEGTAARLAKSDKPARAIAEELFLRTFSRFPSDDEAAGAAGLIDAAPKGGRQTVVEDLLWTLVNSKEFLFAH